MSRRAARRNGCNALKSEQERYPGCKTHQHHICWFDFSDDVLGVPDALWADVSHPNCSSSSNTLRWTAAGDRTKQAIRISMNQCTNGSLSIVSDVAVVAHGSTRLDTLSLQRGVGAVQLRLGWHRRPSPAVMQMLEFCLFNAESSQMTTHRDS